MCIACRVHVGSGARKRERREKESLVHIILAFVYRSEAWANQTDIIDLTCDLEIRKIADGEGLEPIIIVNTGRPSPFYLLLLPPPSAAVATAILSLSLPPSMARRLTPASDTVDVFEFPPPFPYAVYTY